jgi:hypothetical protein
VQRLTAELSDVRDQMLLKEQELSVAIEKLKEKEEMLRTMTRDGGATPELLIELHQQTALTLSFATVQLQNGHTEATAGNMVTPASCLAREVDISMPGMEGTVDLNFASLVDDESKKGTLRTGPGSIFGEMHPRLFVLP